MSRLENLSYIDFEELCRDLAQAETGKRFSAFGPGPDGGVDGRHSKGDEKTILQCKHYEKSSFTTLKTAVKNEIKKIEQLSPKQYLFYTSQSLTPNKSDKIANILGSLLKSPNDIWGLEDIEDALRRNPEIEKSNIKLWLSSTAVLERILQSGLESFTQATKSEILDELKVYARNPSFDSAIEKLESEKILIVSGPPGVGKTTLAKMVVYSYLKEGWSFYAINSLEEGFAKINDEKPTVFFFDDFLGRIELDRQSLLQRDTALSLFVKRVRRSKNARFILTTRAHIFEEARRLSDHVDDRKLQLSKYLLDVGVYTRKIKSHIFFNHLIASELSQAHFKSLLEDNWLGRIIDHKNYNPRVIASVSSDCIDSVDHAEYPKYIYLALENPDLIWSKPFNSLNIKSQNLLVALFFGSEYGQEIEVLKENYLELHRAICLFYSQPAKPNDFEEALRSLESGFISIVDNTVSFVNPSVRDFLKSYLIDKEFLSLLSEVGRRSDWINHFWKHIKEVFKTHEEDKVFIASKFIGFAEIIDATPTMKRTKNNNIYYRHDDLPLSERVEMLFEWWECTHEEFFIKKALVILQANSLELVSWRDGATLPELHWWVYNFIDDDCLDKLNLMVAIEIKLVEVFDEGIPSDELVAIVEKTEEFMTDTVSYRVKEALDQSVNNEFTDTCGAISHLDTEDELSEHLEFLDALGKATGKDPELAKMVVYDRMSEIEEEYQPVQKTNFAQSDDNDQEEFSDDDLNSLFANLIKS